MSDTTEASSIAKTVNILDAITWLKLAWDTVTPTTIQKCFFNCGFSEAKTDTEEPAPPADSTNYQSLLGDVTMEEYATADNNLVTSVGNSTNWEEEFLAKASGDRVEEENEEQDEEQEEANQTKPPPTCNQASDYLRHVRELALLNDNEELLTLMTKSLACLDEMRCSQAQHCKADYH